eukprot:13410207-Heterocapsa_arctica.AAC.1
MPAPSIKPTPLRPATQCSSPTKARHSSGFPITGYVPLWRHGTSLSGSAVPSWPRSSEGQCGA